MTRITLESADTIIGTALKLGIDQGWKPLSVAVLDAGGHLIAFARQDGGSNMRFQIAHGKAHGALALGAGSRSLMARAEQQPTFMAAVVAAVGGALLPVPGGVLVRDSDNAIVGAVGVTGDTSDNDEHAAVTGIQAAGFEADPG